MSTTTTITATKGEHHHHDHGNERRDHADLFVDQLGAHVAEGGGDVCIVGSERGAHRVQGCEAGVVRLRIVEGHGVEGGGLAVVLGGVVEGDALHALDLLEILKQRFGLRVGDVGHHQVRRAVGDELLLHHLQALLGLGARRQVGGQVVLYFHPAAGEEGEDHEDPHQQEHQISLIDNERGKLHHKAAAVLLFVVHRKKVPLLSKCRHKCQH